MLNTGKLANRTAFISGASRGIGKAIALKLARDGANIIIAAKTAEPHPKLPGTIYTAAKEVEEAGGKCLPCIVDIRYEDQVLKAVDEGVRKFGGIDIVVNNASAISLTGTEATDMKRFDLMHGINLRGTFLVSKCCIPYLRKGKNPHILNISPPLNMKPIWFKNHVAYTMAKYGMSMCVLGMAEELRNDNIAVNALWPKSAIQTAAMVMLSGGQEAAGQWRKPEIVSDSAYVILTKDSRNFTGNFCIDEQVLKDAGVTDFDQYAVVPGQKLMPDFFLDEAIEEIETTASSTTSSSSAIGVDKVFNTINAKLSETLVSEVKATYEFVLSGEENGTWYLDLKNNKGATGKGKSPSEPDVIFTMDSNDFLKMFSGKLNTTTAFMVGKLKIQGNMGKAMKLSNLLKQMVSKL